MPKKLKTILGITPANDNMQTPSNDELKAAMKTTADAIKKAKPGSVEHNLLSRRYKIIQSHLRESVHNLNKKVMSVEQLAKKHKVSVGHIQKQLRNGIKVEKEHSTFSSAAKKIALAHLGEDPNYYIKLKKIEKK